MGFCDRVTLFIEFQLHCSPFHLVQAIFLLCWALRVKACQNMKDRRILSLLCNMPASCADSFINTEESRALKEQLQRLLVCQNSQVCLLTWFHCTWRSNVSCKGSWWISCKLVKCFFSPSRSILNCICFYIKGPSGLHLKWSSRNI